MQLDIVIVVTSLGWKASTFSHILVCSKQHFVCFYDRDLYSFGNMAGSMSNSFAWWWIWHAMTWQYIHINHRFYSQKTPRWEGLVLGDWISWDWIFTHRSQYSVSTSWTTQHTKPLNWIIFRWCITIFENCGM